jgi:hypothetical protein
VAVFRKLQSLWEQARSFNQSTSTGQKNDIFDNVFRPLYGTYNELSSQLVVKLCMLSQLSQRSGKFGNNECDRVIHNLQSTRP